MLLIKVLSRYVFIFIDHRLKLSDLIATRRKSQSENVLKNNLELVKASARVVLEHPTAPMADGDIEIFRINKASHQKCQMEENMYHVKKTENRQMIQEKLSINVRFKASIGWISGENQVIASAACSPGWINTVDVEPFARGCGISTILTELCLIDPAVNALHPSAENSVSNRALSMIINYPVDANYVKYYCKAFMGMIMTSRPVSGAHGYFNAALRQGYKRMLILSRYQLHYLWVQDAKRLYQSEPSLCKGWIGNENEGCPHCNNGGAIEAWNHEWFFCKDT